ncbi:MAG: tRNA (N6-isopentenyl adenosine(37)-C2)-methylthiotransferase MiaB [Candidatus Omnitrophica bacterium]|nr:tRNA (N6-isopentenyl adenosine(37)-C2)-methylthiotransferase MiaB [Candidatus Omnitrophota bacterium]
MKKSVYVRSYGCQMNVRDGEEVVGLLMRDGYALVEGPEQADVALFNTCSVREHAEDRVWSNVGALKSLKQQRPGLVIGILGCMAQAHRETIFKRMPHVDFVAGPASLYDVPELIETIQEERRPQLAVSRRRRPEFQQVSYHAGGASALVTIMEGCDKFCTYCIIPFTRGREVSRPADQIVEEVRGVVRQGFQEVMLLGQNVNSYGRRRLDGPPTTFPELLRRVSAVPGLRRVRFITSHPHDADEAMFQAMREAEPVCEHLHLPVQSGSDAVLARMQRGYTVEEYLEKISRVRRFLPDIGLSTDVIVGFPGETEDDFAGTLRLMETVRFDSAFMFNYSPRPMAKASGWPDDVPAEVKDRRLQALMALQERIGRERNQACVGRTVEVLVEGPSPKDPLEWTGRARDNRHVVFPGGAQLRGQLVQVQVRQVRGHTLAGTVIG